MTSSIKNNGTAGSTANHPWTVRYLRFFTGLAIGAAIIGALVMAYPDTSPDPNSSGAPTSHSQVAGSDIKVVGLSGRLSRIEGQTLILQLDSGRQATLKTVSTTTIVQRLPNQSVNLSSASTIGLEALKPGDQLTVLARTPAANWLTGEADRVILER